MKAIFSNPVFAKELKLRFRSFKSFNGLLFFLLAMCVFVFGFIYIMTNFNQVPYMKPSESVILFNFLAFIQLGLILFSTPGLTAGTISSEREKQTLPMLLTTSQTSFQIIAGKLLSSVAFLLLLIIAGLPIYSLVFLFGGISPVQFIKILFYLFITLLTIGSLGVMFSTLIRRTIVSMIVTYGSMLFLTVVSAFLFFISVQVQLMGTGGVMKDPAYIGYFFAMINPGILFGTLVLPEVNNQIQEFTLVEFPLWLGFLIFYAIVTIFAIFISVKKLRVNMKRTK